MLSRTCINISQVGFKFTKVPREKPILDTEDVCAENIVVNNSYKWVCNLKKSACGAVTLVALLGIALCPAGAGRGGGMSHSYGGGMSHSSNVSRSSDFFSNFFPERTGNEAVADRSNAPASGNADRRAGGLFSHLLAGSTSLEMVQAARVKSQTGNGMASIGLR